MCRSVCCRVCRSVRFRVFALSPAPCVPACVAVRQPTTGRIVCGLRVFFSVCSYISSLCNTLQHTATHCNTLQHTATHYNTLQYTTSCIPCFCSVCLCASSVSLHHTVTHSKTVQQTNENCKYMHCVSFFGVCFVSRASTARCRHCNALQQSAANCSLVQHTAASCNTLQLTARHCNTLQHSAAHCNTLQHSAKHCNTPPHTTAHSNTLHHTPAICNTLQHSFYGVLLCI